MDWLPTDEDDDEELDWWFEMMWGLPRGARFEPHSPANHADRNVKMSGMVTAPSRL
jgi:hypothetical protein